MNKICLNVLIGIPGAGKTTFCERFQEYLLDKHLSIQLIHVSYDNILQTEENFQFENRCFKEKRRKLLESVEELIKGVKNHDQTCIDRVNGALYREFKAEINVQLDSFANGKVYAFFLDDNMYYRSMRYEVLCLARKHRIGYMQLFFDIPLKIALSRNANRPRPITEKVVSRMWIKMERPSSKFYKWERNTLELLGNTSEFEQIWQTLVACSKNPESLPGVETAKKPIEQSIVHKVDLLLRKSIGEIMKNRKAILDITDRKLLSHHLLERRKTILQEMRAGLLTIDPECVTTEQIQLLM